MYRKKSSLLRARFRLPFHIEGLCNTLTNCDFVLKRTNFKYTLLCEYFRANRFSLSIPDNNSVTFCLKTDLIMAAF